MSGALDPAALGTRAEAMIKTLAPISAEPNRLVRLFLSPEHRRAADQAAAWMREAGLSVSEDALGTVRGRLGEGRRLLIGSHLDSVIDGGNYDGPLGVIAAIIVADETKKRGIPVVIDVLAFGDEEGSRFPATMTSSSACAGNFDITALDLPDRKGITLRDALKAYGKNPADIPKAAYSKGEVFGYVELHIEQGPRLEAASEPLGVVTGIVGQNKIKVVVTGEAGHAGTVPMGMRHDAFLAAGEMALAAEKIASAEDGMVATVGRVDVAPGAVNIIPGRVEFSLDLRAMNNDKRQTSVARFKQETERIARKRKVAVEVDVYNDKDATPCDTKLQDLLAAAISDLGHKPLRLSSGAGHDGQEMAKLCPPAMMFVRCRKGISHNPAEYCSPQDMGTAIAALIRFVERFAASQ